MVPRPPVLARLCPARCCRRSPPGPPPLLGFALACMMLKLAFEDALCSRFRLAAADAACARTLRHQPWKLESMLPYIMLSYVNVQLSC